MASTWLPVFEAQRPSTPGAVAHMSLHLNLQCQRTHRQNLADNQSSPIFLPGDLVSDYVGDRCGGGLSRPLPAGDVAYMEGVSARQRDFAFFLKLLPNHPETLRFANVAQNAPTHPQQGRSRRIERITRDSAFISKTLSAMRLRKRSDDQRFPPRSRALLPSRHGRRLCRTPQWRCTACGRDRSGLWRGASCW